MGEYKDIIGGNTKSTSIVRNVDELGRIVIPIELRRTLRINVKDPLEIFTEGDTIILRKFSGKCSICGEDENLKDFKNKKLCLECIEFIGSKRA